LKALMVGMALDTNGQKMRYVDAAKRWGDDPDILKALIAGSWEGAGIPVRFAIASQKHGGLSIRSAHKATAYFKFPEDINWSKGNESLVRQLAEEADVVHLTNDVKAYIYLRLPRLRKPAVLHHHGTLFRNNPKRMLAEGDRFHMVQAVSTIDLMRPAPDVLRWLPAPYDLDEMAAIREINRRPDDGLVRIVSAPTHREWKSTDALEAAVRQLKAEGLPVELVLVTGRPWAECLTVKATADIYFDQVKLGYGCNAVEAWGMGIPVVAGADDWTLDRMRQEWNTKQLPFYQATEETIADVLRELVKSSGLRATYAARGYDHAAKYHAEKPALARLAEVYHAAIQKMAHAPTAIPPDHRTGPGHFTSRKRNLQVRLASHSVTFVDGKAHITDPRTAQRLRQWVQFDNRHGIAEVFEEEVA
jgi:hypothetical protein